MWGKKMTGIGNDYLPYNIQHATHHLKERSVPYPGYECKASISIFKNKTIQIQKCGLEKVNAWGPRADFPARGGAYLGNVSGGMGGGGRPVARITLGAHHGVIRKLVYRRAGFIFGFCTAFRQGVRRSGRMRAIVRMRLSFGGGFSPDC